MIKIEKYLKKTFSDSSVANYDLFSAQNKGSITSIIGHPFLQEISPFAWLIRKKSVEVSFNPRKGIPDALLQFIYSHIIEDHKDCWTIVGDETGDLGEFSGEKPKNHHSAMCWVVIPPQSKLPGLPSGFHVHEDENYMLMATDNLSESNEVDIYQFKYASGNKNRGCSIRISPNAPEFLEGHIAPCIKQNFRTLKGNAEGSNLHRTCG
jgi:hypothetical protein